MIYKKHKQFEKEFKKFIKKYPSLDDDLKEFIEVISKYPLGSGRHFNIIYRGQYLYVVKARFFCRYLRGSSLHIIYAYHVPNKAFEFIELYFKSDKQNEDYDRIKEYRKYADII